MDRDGGGGEGASEGAAGTAAEGGDRVAALDRDGEPGTGHDPVELGVELLARLEGRELELSDVVDRIETITTDPRTTRAILETAEARGHIDREGATVRPAGGGPLRAESEIVTREGEFDCRRCGASISTGHFLRLDAGELGPFGSSCVRTVTGRE